MVSTQTRHSSLAHQGRSFGRAPEERAHLEDRTGEEAEGLVDTPILEHLVVAEVVAEPAALLPEEAEQQRRRQEAHGRAPESGQHHSRRHRQPEGAHHLSGHGDHVRKLKKHTKKE